MSVLLLLLLLVCTAQASHFYGTVMTYYPKETNTDGSVRVVLRYKLGFSSHLISIPPWDCPGNNCGNATFVEKQVDQESSGEWYQEEGFMTRWVPNNNPFALRLDGGNWILNIKNSIQKWRAVTLVELRTRSDTGQANRSPQTTVIPAIRVPSNCQRNFPLLAFDPDGDDVKCRYAASSLSECTDCTLPSVLSLSSSCTLTFNPTSSSDEGPYAVQMVMEDFPKKNITLRNSSGVQEVRTTNDAISKIPVQFVLRVDPVVPSCTDGLYLPKFLPPTPANRAQLFTTVNQTVEININTEAKNSTISELLFSGPYDVVQGASGDGRFNLSWTPSQREEGESHPICFVVQATSSSVKYHSELRCVIVTVSNYVVALQAKILSFVRLTESDFNDTIINELKDVLVRQGIPSDAQLRLVKVTETTPSGG